VLTVTHLLYTTGHTAPTGDQLVRAELVERSLDLARMLSTLMPDDREVRGLLALLLLTDARRATRTAADGRLLLLEEQDRTHWDRQAIGEGRQLVNQALRRGRPGRFALQAAIAAVHAEAPSSADTDWPEVLGLYDLLLVVWPSPVVALNRAVAVAMVEGPAAGLAALEEVADDPHLATYPYLAATRADLLRRLGRTHDAAQAYRTALTLATNATEKVGPSAIEANGARPVTIGADPQGLSLILGRCRISSIASATISSCGNAVYHARLASRSVLAGRSSMAREPGGPRCLESWWWYWPRRPRSLTGGSVLRKAVL
jgi:hypothetical protein